MCFCVEVFSLRWPDVDFSNYVQFWHNFSLHRVYVKTICKWWGIVYDLPIVHQLVVSIVSGILELPELLTSICCLAVTC